MCLTCVDLDTEEEAARICSSILSAVSYMHGKGMCVYIRFAHILVVCYEMTRRRFSSNSPSRFASLYSIHRDLKYENILFADDSPHAEIKLIDFGLSKECAEHDELLTDGVGTMCVVYESAVTM